MFQHIIESISHLPVPELKLRAPTASVILQSFNAYAAGRPRWPDAYWERAQLLRATHEVYTQVLELQKVFILQEPMFSMSYSRWADELWHGMLPSMHPKAGRYLGDWERMCKAAPKPVKLTSTLLMQNDTKDFILRHSECKETHTLLTIKGQDAYCVGFHCAFTEPNMMKLRRHYDQHGSIFAGDLSTMSIGNLPYTLALVLEATKALNKNLETSPWP